MVLKHVAIRKSIRLVNPVRIRWATLPALLRPPPTLAASAKGIHRFCKAIPELRWECYNNGMELRQLRTFVIASDLLSFTRAAETLKMTQGAVSQQMAALEKDLGVSLFDRCGRQVVLTEAGCRFQQYARQILDLVDEAKREFTQTATEVRGLLRIAASTVPAETLLPQLLNEFRRMYPGVRECVDVSDTSQATRAVESGEADIGLVGELPKSSQLHSLPLASDELTLVVDPNHRFAKKGVASVNDLRDEPLILREEGSASRHCLEEAIESKGLAMSELSIVVEVNSNDAIRSAVQCGTGIAFLSKSAVKDDDKIVPIRLRGLRPRRDLYVINAASRQKVSPVREFLDFIGQWKPPTGH